MQPVPIVLLCDSCEDAAVLPLGLGVMDENLIILGVCANCRKNTYTVVSLKDLLSLPVKSLSDYGSIKHYGSN